MMRGERVARLAVVIVALALPLGAVVAGRLLRGAGVIELRARMPDAGGWQPGELVVRVGEPLRLRVTSDDVVHGFAIGEIDLEPVDVKPGEVTELTLSFAEPGRYVYYCTRWCGPDHWRMRGTIEVTGLGEGAGLSPGGPLPVRESDREAAWERPPGGYATSSGGLRKGPDESRSPLFMALGIDLDAPHPARHVPANRPSAEKAGELSVPLPPGYMAADLYLRGSPDAVWEALRADTITRGLSDMQVWDLVAWLWTRDTTPEMVAEGERLYRANCAACHGEGGAGDGVMARSLAPPARPKKAELTGSAMGDSMAGFGHETVAPADFTDPRTMLGASSALLEGKIIRGGMGTGMPYWGPIFTDRQVRALIAYLWTFQFEAPPMSEAAADSDARRP